VASARVIGEAQTIADLRALQFKMRDKALIKAAHAGAEVAKAAIEKNAPVARVENRNKRETGPIRNNIIIYQRRRTHEEKGTAVSLLVGPNKLGFYGYFIHHGIAGKTQVRPREFVDRAFNECKGRMRQAVINVLEGIVKAG
jgi:HK97 gp10 family phage protein